ncbi:MAG TPA: hypothetical protein VNN21_07965 [Dehalococcoidia bacterium]|nr:hypothetical protein [Dehalococcoidia bacterium]
MLQREDVLERPVEVVGDERYFFVEPLVRIDERLPRVPETTEGDLVVFGQAAGAAGP